MKMYIFLIILALITTGCIPKYVDQDKKRTIVKAPKVSIPSQPETIIQAKPTTQIIEQEQIVSEVIEEQKKSTSYKVTMKTKKFAFSDTGFLVKYENSMHLNVLAMGKSVLDMKIKKDEDDICVGSLCNTKHGFNQSFLVGSYPDGFIENVLQRKPIFGGRGLTKTSKGFVQKIICNTYGIKYQVTNKSVYFKDKKGNILIKLKEIN